LRGSSYSWTSSGPCRLFSSLRTRGGARLERQVSHGIARETPGRAAAFARPHLAALRTMGRRRNHSGRLRRRAPRRATTYPAAAGSATLRAPGSAELGAVPRDGRETLCSRASVSNPVQTCRHTDPAAPWSLTLSRPRATASCVLDVVRAPGAPTAAGAKVLRRLQPERLPGPRQSR